MIKVSVFYANGEGKHFDIAYYCEKHMKLVQRLCGAAIKGIAVEHGVSGMAPGTPAPFLAMGHLISKRLKRFRLRLGRM